MSSGRESEPRKNTGESTCCQATKGLFGGTEASQIRISDFGFRIFQPPGQPQRHREDTEGHTERFSKGIDATVRCPPTRWNFEFRVFHRTSPPHHTPEHPGPVGQGAAEVPFLTLFEPRTLRFGRVLRANNVKGGSSREARAETARAHRRCLASRHDVVLKPPAAAE